ncbi:hypothetical protein [Kingella pumchi]|uniref:Lipoprotein n=1 Tax=Kingella pumchi TaxID=2779506 RepID=A0ABS9NQ85_9NEIS|nr:hypothetical protein [Kingella pumchi]MCG6504727.1 hypothetical protein [Kingella pumchi]
MKKLLAVTLVAFLAACTDPKSIVLTKKEDIEKHAEELGKLSSEEKQLVVAYLLRAELGGAFGGEGNDKAVYGVTIGEAIEKQKAFIEKQKALIEAQQKQELEQKAEEEQARKELEEKRKQLNEAVSVIFVEHHRKEGQFSFQKYDIFSFKIKNNSQKNITGIKGTTVFFDKFGDELTRLEMKNDFQDNGGKLAAGQDYTWQGQKDILLRDDEKLADTPTEDLKFVYEPDTVLFEDGTSLTVK